MKKWSYLMFGVLLAFAGCDKKGPGTFGSGGTHAATTVDRDNTAVNVRDRDPAAKTPIDQNENKKDVDITAEIRKRVVDTKMSVDAQNVKIMTQDGRVALRGPVKSQEEKTQIEGIARDVAGATNVDSTLEVVAR